jgi:hypothetical protein
VRAQRVVGAGEALVQPIERPLRFDEPVRLEIERSASPPTCRAASWTVHTLPSDFDIFSAPKFTMPLCSQ